MLGAAAFGCTDDGSNYVITTGSCRGNNHTFVFNVPSSACSSDTTHYNVLKINVVSGSTGSGFLSPGTSFDCIDLLT